MARDRSMRRKKKVEEQRGKGREGRRDKTKRDTVIGDERKKGIERKGEE